MSANAPWKPRNPGNRSDQAAGVGIGLIGDRNPNVAAHVAIPPAIEAAAAHLACRASIQWLPTDAPSTQDPAHLSQFDGLWCVPACPYRSMEGALAAIRFARENDVPFMGTCGGFQHAIIEYARDVMGLIEADHAECHPEASMPIITPLACSLVGHVGPIRLAPGSRAARLYGSERSVEKYHCNYGLDAAFRDRLDAAGLRITATDESGEPRIVELPGRRFFMGTLFQPELSSTAQAVHPLITGFITAAARRPAAVG